MDLGIKSLRGVIGVLSEMQSGSVSATGAFFSPRLVEDVYLILLKAEHYSLKPWRSQ